MLLDTSVCAVDMIGSQLFQVHPAFEGGVYKSSPSYLPAYIVLRFVRSPLIVLQQSSCLAKQIFLGSNRSAVWDSVRHCTRRQFKKNCCWSYVKSDRRLDSTPNREGNTNRYENCCCWLLLSWLSNIEHTILCLF